MSENDESKPKQHEGDEQGESEPTIRLDQFLKACGVPTGGQAKLLIQGGEVQLNGVVETRRKKKLVQGDEVIFDGEVFLVAKDEQDEEG
jgi:ribosome-associated protein